MSLWTVASGEAFFLKVFINYSFSFIYMITFIYYCLNRIKNLDTILYSFGMAGPLVGLIATGYKITGQNMLQNALGLENSDVCTYSCQQGIFHYASLLRYTYTNVHLIILISIFAWFQIIKKYNILNKFNINKNFDVFHKFMFIFNINIYIIHCKIFYHSFYFNCIFILLLLILTNLLNSPLKIKKNLLNSYFRLNRRIYIHWYKFSFKNTSSS